MSDTIYNIFCDESCHLENDDSNVMVLGAIKCLESKRKQHNDAIRNLKIKHGMSSWNELKWVKVSSSKIEFYSDLIDYFLENDDLSFRAWIAPKDGLRHDEYDQNHNVWYYKMYFNLLDKMISEGIYSVFLDIKDTQGGRRVSKLWDVVANSHYDFSKEAIRGIYQIRSTESELIQLADLFIGAICYYRRGFYHEIHSSGAKRKVVSLISKKTE